MSFKGMFRKNQLPPKSAFIYIFLTHISKSTEISPVSFTEFVSHFPFREFSDFLAFWVPISPFFSRNYIKFFAAQILNKTFFIIINIASHLPNMKSVSFVWFSPSYEAMNFY